MIDDEFADAVNEHLGVIPLSELIKISKPKPKPLPVVEPAIETEHYSVTAETE